MAQQEFVATLEKASAAKLKPVKGKSLNHRPLVGSWRNCDKNTRGLVRIDLGTRKGALTVHPFGACSPKPCDWGTVRGQAYAESVTSRDAVAFTARFKTSFKITIVTGHLCDGCLVVETYTRFTDKSGRCPYYSRACFCRK